MARRRGSQDRTHSASALLVALFPVRLQGIDRPYHQIAGLCRWNHTAPSVCRRSPGDPADHQPGIRGRDRHPTAAIRRIIGTLACHQRDLSTGSRGTRGTAHRGIAPCCVCRNVRISGSTAETLWGNRALRLSFIGVVGYDKDGAVAPKITELTRWDLPPEHGLSAEPMSRIAQGEHHTCGYFSEALVHPAATWPRCDEMPGLCSGTHGWHSRGCERPPEDVPTLVRTVRYPTTPSLLSALSRKLVVE